MRLTHFFNGSLGKEEVSSAFLAMLLEGSPEFRNYFFQQILPNEAQSLAELKWSTAVEQRQIDVLMKAGNTIIIIENKLNQGAKQVGQLNRYYSREKEENPNARIFAVYLAPRQIGKDEVDRVKSSLQFRESKNDHAQHVSWEKLVEYSPLISQPYDIIIKNGFEEIQRIIFETRQQKYICEGEREILRRITDIAYNLLQPRTKVPLFRWSAKNTEEIVTKRTNVTMWLHLVFETEDNPPFNPINIRHKNGQISIKIRSQFKLAGVIKKTSNLGHWWQQQIDRGNLSISEIGPHHFKNNWFMYTQTISGTDEKIALALMETGEAVLKTLYNKLDGAGFQLIQENKR